jgi:hypothetical protein
MVIDRCRPKSGPVCQRLDTVLLPTACAANHGGGPQHRATGDGRSAAMEVQDFLEQVARHHDLGRLENIEPLRANPQSSVTFHPGMKSRCERLNFGTLHVRGGGAYSMLVQRLWPA